MREYINIIRLVHLIPTIGIMVFVGLYIYAAALYPGGSQADLGSEGFDWVHNYWCNLMNEEGMNGLPNPARPIAIAAMIILCISLMIFFFQFAHYYVTDRTWKMIIFITSSLSMLSATLISTSYHDVMTTISTVFGFILVIGVIKAVYSSKMSFWKVGGVVCILLLIINNYIYYSGNSIEWLPLIQKITFALVLLWIIGLNIRIDK